MNIHSSMKSNNRSLALTESLEENIKLRLELEQNPRADVRGKCETTLLLEQHLNQSRGHNEKSESDSSLMDMELDDDTLHMSIDHPAPELSAEDTPMTNLLSFYGQEGWPMIITDNTELSDPYDQIQITPGSEALRKRIEWKK